MSVPTQTPPLLRFTLLGGFRLSVGGRDVASIPRKGRALLAYLAAQDGRATAREAVSDLLWTGRGEQARHSLRQLLVDMRRSLGIVWDDAITGDDGTLALTPGTWTSDLGDFRTLAASTERAGLGQASKVYGGAFLDDFPVISINFDRWVARSRTGITDNALAVLGRLAASCAAERDAAQEIETLDRMATLAPAREDVQRRLMEALARAGRREDAILQYEKCAEALRGLRKLKPSPETDRVLASIRDNTLPAQDAAPRRLYPHPAGGPPRIAVLPFDDFGDTALPRHVADGLVADIVCQLAGLRELHVISHGSTLGLRERGLDMREAGRMLGARYLVRGAIRRGERSIRLTTELADAETGEVVWARNADTGTTLSFAAQDRIVAQVVNTLAPQVMDAELRRVRGKRPDSLSVYDKALLAREHMMTLSRDSLDAARPLLEDVIGTEPGWGEGQALAADWHGLFVAQGWSTDRARDIETIEQLARTALSLDSENIRALVFYGHRKSLLHRDYPAALQLFQKALEVAPSSVPAWLWSSYTFSYLGDPAEAVRRAQNALELSPRDREAHRFLGALCVAYYTAGDYAAAAEWGLRALEEPAVGRTTGGWTAAALAAAERIDEAHDVAARTMARWPERRVTDVVANHPYQDPERRRMYGLHLLNAGFPH